MTARPATAPAALRAGTQGREGRWVPAGESVKVSGLVIGGGLLYVGRRLDPAGFGRDVEPALIDPSLPVWLSEPDLTGSSLGYGLSYARISPRARAGYLHWLWTGRKDPRAPIGYVYLYLFGLERRMLHDRLLHGGPSEELAVVHAEVERLRAIYGADDRFGVQAGRFAEVLEVVGRAEHPSPGPLPPPTDSVGELSPILRFELARLAAGGGRLPAEWALAWVRQAPDIRLRTPAERCAEEFDRLFLLRYRSRFGDGLALTDGQPRLRLYYRPASPGFTGEVRLPLGDLPDPSVLSGPTRRLAELAGSVADELGPYSRLVGKAPDRRGTLGALALLPPELAAGGAAEAAEALVRRAEALLGDAELALVDVDELWPERGQAGDLARILESRGIGIEPDVRFGGPPDLGKGRAVLFRSAGHETPPRCSPMTVGAAHALIRLTALVAGAGGAPAPTHDMAGVVELATRLAGGGQAPAGVLHGLPLRNERVTAGLYWALATRPGTSGLKRRLATLDDDLARSLGERLVALAAGSGRIGPAQMAALTEAFRALGLDPDRLFGLVHQATVDPRPAPAGSGGGLDAERIRARLAETADVAAFLGEIFVDDDPPPPPTPPAPAGPGTSATPAAPAGPTTTAAGPAAPPPSAPAGLAGLDAAHAELLRRLAARSSWSRDEFEGLAGGCGLLPDGALDTLNEAALDQAGEAVCEGDDPVEINELALRELLP